MLAFSSESYVSIATQWVTVDVSVHVRRESIHCGCASQHARKVVGLLVTGGSAVRASAASRDDALCFPDGCKRVHGEVNVVKAVRCGQLAADAGFSLGDHGEAESNNEDAFLKDLVSKFRGVAGVADVDGTNRVRRISTNRESRVSHLLGKVLHIF
eukprot:m.1302507 g.1302507  ORF g.1302507 m.1302507 type:complete len:156 (+) comp24808_c0_seq2:3298-3765(+)